MADIVSPSKRSQMMAGIRGKNTKPELVVRRALFARGFRYRLHDSALLGKPDLVFPRYRAVIFVHGCFWHRHNCALFKLPGTRQSFWAEKLSANVERDKTIESESLVSGWRIANVWECALMGKNKVKLPQLAAELDAWLNGKTSFAEFTGR
jgi:DNA mismatch endonuclease (patch repair protein)